MHVGKRWGKALVGGAALCASWAAVGSARAQEPAAEPPTRAADPSDVEDGAAAAPPEVAVAAPAPPTALPPPPPPAPGRVTPRRFAALEQRLIALEDRARMAEARAAQAERNAVAAVSSAKSTSVLDANGRGFVLRSADHDYALELRGVAAFDGRKYIGDPSLVDSDGFLVRKIRPSIDATALGFVDLRLMMDFADKTNLIQDAYADVRPTSWFKIRVGKFTPPVGLERAQSDGDLTFIERSVANNLVASRDVGVMATVDVGRGFVNASLGATNGAPDNGMVDLDSNQGKDIVGRLWLRPQRLSTSARFGDFSIGLAGSTGTRKGAAVRDRTGLATLRSGGQTAVFSYRLSDTDPTATTYAEGQHTRINPQLCYFVGPFGLMAEYVLSAQKVRRADESKLLRHSAWTAGANWVFGGRATFAGAAVDRFDWDAGAYGALELAVRYGELVLDKDAFPTFADPARAARQARALSAAMTWHMGRNLRVSANLEQTAYVASVRGPGLARTGERAVLARTQVAF